MMRITITVVIPDHKSGNHISTGLYLRIINNRYHLQGILTSFQAHGISTVIGAVTTDELVINTGKISILSSLHIDMISSGAGIIGKFHVSRFQPSLCIDNLNTLRIREFLGKDDTRHGTIEDICPCPQIHGDASCSLIQVYSRHIRRIIVFLVARCLYNLRLIHIEIPCHGMRDNILGLCSYH